MDVSIVIVSFNTSRLLDECIVSIKRETKASHEIIVVDNASSDDTCRMLRTKHPDVKLIENQENVGFARANNQGFAISQGRYFFMLNPDTVILENAIDKLIDFMDENPDVGISGPKNISPDGSIQYSCDHFPSIWNTFCSYTNLINRYPSVAIFRRPGMRYWNYSGVRDVDRVAGCALMIRAGTFKKLCGLDENYFMYFEETDLCYRTLKSGLRVVYLPSAMIIHYGGESTMALPRQDILNRVVFSYYLTSQYYFYRKHYGVLPMVAIRLLDLGYGVGLIVKNINRSDRIARKQRLAKGRTLCAAATTVIK